MRMPNKTPMDGTPGAAGGGAGGEGDAPGADAGAAAPGAGDGKGGDAASVLNAGKAAPVVRVTRVARHQARTTTSPRSSV